MQPRRLAAPVATYLLRFLNQREHRSVGLLGDKLARVQVLKLSDEREAGNSAACSFDQLLLSDGGAAGGNQVVNDKDDVAGLDGVGVDLQRIGAVFKLVALRDDLARKLAGLACGNEPRRRQPW